MKAANQVLRELDAVAAQQQRATVELVLEALEARSAGLAGRHLVEPRRVCAEGGDEGRGRLDADGRRAPHESVAPPRRVKPASTETGHGLHQLEAGPVRHHGEVLRRTERGVGEERRREIGPALCEIPADERQVIVVHDHRRPGRGLLCDRVGKGLVELAVPFPRLVPDPVETRAARMVEQAVVQEPQSAVGDHVVGRPPDLGS